LQPAAAVRTFDSTTRHCCVSGSRTSARKIDIDRRVGFIVTGGPPSVRRDAIAQPVVVAGRLLPPLVRSDRSFAAQPLLPLAVMP
jgi:hypothetical protein